MLARSTLLALLAVAATAQLVVPTEEDLASGLLPTDDSDQIVLQPSANTIYEPKICDPTVQQYSGYLSIAKNKNLFFWFFESRVDPANAPLLLWLNGGPGCSSLTGLFFELGPCIIPEGSDPTPVFNPNSWNSFANVIFLDQPVGTGFSTGSATVSSSRTVGDDVLSFMQMFYSQFPQYYNRKFHIVGESYAGHYIPAIATAINTFNKGNPKEPIPLDSIAIGNGLTDPLTQYAYYPTMAYNSTYGPIVSQSTYNKMVNNVPACLNKIQKCYDGGSSTTCFSASTTCNSNLITPYSNTGQNVYDVRKPCGNSNLCYDLSGIEKYLALKEVKAALGVSTSWVECSTTVNLAFNFAGDWMKPYVNDIQPLLNSGIRVLIYAGDADYICNWYGNAAWVQNLDPRLRRSYQPWFVNGKQAGELLSVGSTRNSDGTANIAFLRIYEAGHMAPTDQPENSLDMIERWLNNETF